MTLYSNLAPSGYVNVEPIVREIVALTGLDPEEIVRPPQPKASEPINISVRNAEDLQSPLFVSMLVHTQQAPTPEDIAAAHQIIQAAATPPPALPPPPMPPQLPPPGVPLGPPTTPVDELMVWETAPRVNRRRAPGAEDGGMG
jgi:hypothetical protein